MPYGALVSASALRPLALGIILGFLVVVTIVGIVLSKRA